MSDKPKDVGPVVPLTHRPLDDHEQAWRDAGWKQGAGYMGYAPDWTGPNGERMTDMQMRATLPEPVVPPAADATPPIPSNEDIKYEIRWYIGKALGRVVALSDRQRSRELSLVLTKLDEADLWMGRLP